MFVSIFQRQSANRAPLKRHHRRKYPSIPHKSINGVTNATANLSTSSTTVNSIYEYSEEKHLEAEHDFQRRRDHLWNMCSKYDYIQRYRPNAWEFFISMGHGIAWCNVFKAASSTWMYYFNILGEPHQVAFLFIFWFCVPCVFDDRTSVYALISLCVHSTLNIVWQQTFASAIVHHVNIINNLPRKLFQAISIFILFNIRKLAGGYDVRFLQKTKVSPLELARKQFPRPEPHELNEALASSLSFLIVREPFERLLSGFRNKLEGHRNKFYKLVGEQIIKDYRKGNKRVSISKLHTLWQLWHDNKDEEQIVSSYW